MMKTIVNNLPLHRVVIVYKDGERESISFSIEGNARNFAERQRAIKEVQEARYTNVDIYA